MAANQNVTQLTQQTVSAAASSLFYAVTGGNTDTGLPLSVLVNNLGLTGVPTVPTAAPGTNTTQIASTAYVMASFAPLASPVFTGTPSLPTGTTGVTQTAGNSTTALATTAFVATSYAPLASPTLTGVPLAPTASTGTSTQQLATTAFVANTFAAPPALGATTPNTGSFSTLAASGLISPTSTVGIKGTVAADNAAAGSIGEYLTANTSGTSLSNGVSANATSISLTAGDWDVSGVIQFVPAGSTTVSGIVAGSNNVSATFGGSGSAQSIQATMTTGATQTLAVPTFRYSLASTTTIFLVANSNFAVSTMTCSGTIRARRVR